MADAGGPLFPGAANKVRAFLSGRKAPVVAALLSAIIALYVFGSLRPTRVVHDEAAYLLQANLFASGRWKAPPAPIPEFFEQMYVFVWPFLAAKYPPGFPLALVPGALLGLPAAVPIALIGISGGLLFALAREIANPWIAAFGWTLWITDPHEVSAPPPLISQHLTTALLLAAWWALLRWKARGRLRDLLLLSVSLGWGAITRPLTILAAAIPIAVVVVMKTLREKKWAQLSAAAGTGLAVLMVVPIWNAKTTGNWRVSPLALHVRWYTPYDRLGFGGPFPVSRRKLPPDLSQVTDDLASFGRSHTIRNLPGLVVERTVAIEQDVFPRWRIVFVPLALWGLFVVSAEARFVALSALLLFAAYLFFPHPPRLLFYYLELYPVVAFLAAAGLWQAITTARSRARRDKLHGGSTIRHQSEAVAFLALVLLGTTGLDGLYRYHQSIKEIGAIKTRFRAVIDSIPDARAVVFVRYSPIHLPYRSLVENENDFERERVWLVYDRGPENERLRALAPERASYLYDEARESLTRME